MPVRTQAAARGALAPETERPLLEQLPSQRRTRDGQPPEVASGAAGDAAATAVVAGPPLDEAGGFRPGGTIPTFSSGASYDRRARLDDVDAIWRVVDTYARRGILLPRSLEEIADQIGSFGVVELDGEVVGIVALRDFGGGIGELRSLAVLQPAQGRGFGELLVRSVVKQARRAGIRDLYVLTANPGYFALFGFREVPWESLPSVVDADREPDQVRRRWNTAMVLNP
ncbi:MAG TPA: GNAT family N-acetyltransferase [Candidatus Limnocylindria bacterium]|nr:GNAT family N-acetyltransferase [Candidatus Limnocylindria bacterium]